MWTGLARQGGQGPATDRVGLPYRRAYRRPACGGGGATDGRSVDRVSRDEKPVSDLHHCRHINIRRMQKAVEATDHNNSSNQQKEV